MATVLHKAATKAHMGSFMPDIHSILVINPWNQNDCVEISYDCLPIFASSPFAAASLTVPIVCGIHIPLANALFALFKAVPR